MKKLPRSQQLTVSCIVRRTVCQGRISGITLGPHFISESRNFQVQKKPTANIFILFGFRISLSCIHLFSEVDNPRKPMAYYWFLVGTRASRGLFRSCSVGYQGQSFRCLLRPYRARFIICFRISIPELPPEKKYN